MAKKKKKRTTTSVRPPGASTAETFDRPSRGTTNPSTTPDGSQTATRPAGEGARSNRLARKEEARRQREALRRKMQRRRYYRRGAVALVAVAAIGGIVFLTTRPEARTGEEGRLLNQADQAAAAAGCGEVETVGPYEPESLNQKHVGDPQLPTMPPLSSYPTRPPASGPHSNSTLAAGVYNSPPPMDQAIHSLEHGAVIIWYDPSAPARTLSQIQSFFRQGDRQDHVIVAPYNYPDQGAAGRLPDGKQMALVAWQHVRTCNEVSLPVAYSFVDRYRNSQTAPEAGVPI